MTGWERGGKKINKRTGDEGRTGWKGKEEGR